MTPVVAAVPGDGSNGSHPAPVRSTRGGARGSGRGGLRASRPDRSNPTVADVIPLVACPDVPPSLQSNQISNAPPKEYIINSSTLIDVENLNPQPSDPLSNPKRNLILPPSSLAPPVVRSSIFSSPTSITPNPNCSHAMAVDKVSAALDGDPVVDDSGEEDGYSEEDGSAMSDDDETDDQMTLDQYQKEVRRENLIRKGTLSTSPTMKKGKLEAGEPSS